MKKVVPKTKPAAVTTKPLDLAAYNRGSDKERRPREESVEDLFLDPKNPRLADSPHTGTQASILRVMDQEFDLQPLIDSMYRSGYFWEEPMVVVTEALTEQKGKKVLIVIEGNRRLAALKSIFNNPEQFPDKEALKRLERVPVIERDNRQETLAFVGFRHITGIVQWEAAAKAQYAHGLVKGGHSLEEIAQLIGDKTRDIARWVRTQSLVDHAHDQGLSEDDAAKAFYFSYLLTSTDAPATKKWLDLKSDEKSGLVTHVDPERLKELWVWLYGSKSAETAPVVPESRQIHKLNRVIASSRAVKELQRTGNLDRAVVETKERAEYIIETLGSIRSLLQDLAANLAGEDPFSENLVENAAVREARAEFGRVEKALSQAKASLGF